MVGTTLNGRFHLVALLGQGGMGTVYRANDSLLERTVAVKILKDVAGEHIARRIRLEAQILARLVHENIVRLYDLNIDRDTYYFVMEEVDGPSLFKRWRAVGLSERLRMLAQLAEALDYAHRQGVIHRDVKPGNVLVTLTDIPKLSDFGLSVMVDKLHEAVGAARGTPTYMSPEQAAGRRIDHRTDLYSLGVMLYECITGVPPFVGPPLAVMTQHINVDPERPRLKQPACSADLEELTLTLLAKRPEHRPGSGQEVADRLIEILTNAKVVDPTSARRPAGKATAETFHAVPHLTAAEPTLSGERAETTSAGVLLSKPQIQSSLAVSGNDGRARVLTLVAAVTSDPISLTPDERYLHGHYISYLLGGANRQGLMLRRPLDPLNADRARLLLAMTALCLPGDHAISLGQAAELLDQRLECRPWLSPVIVAKYLACRSTPARRKQFRELRVKLAKASIYASEHMLDAQGLLNPGLMPQKLDDLRRIAPVRTEFDDEVVARWNLVADVWRKNAEFRETVLRYATTNAWREPASIDLWPEVVYPLIERARRQRRTRSKFEALYDLLCGNILKFADAGVKLDRVLARAVPRPVILQLDEEASLFNDDVRIEIDEAPVAEPEEAASMSRTIEISRASFADVKVEEEPDRYLVQLAEHEPVRLTLGELRVLWKEAVANLRSSGHAKTGHSPIAIGPYRLAVVATIRVRSAGQVAIQGMPNKQIELLVPSFTGGGSNDRPVVAAWNYQNNNLVVAYCDHMSQQRYVIWDANLRKQHNFEDRDALDRALFEMGMETPPQLESVLTKAYVPGTAG